MADVPAADGKENKNPSFIVRDGLLVSLGSPGDHLLTDKEYSDSKLTVEYRFSDKPGNGGVLVHASDLLALYEMFPKSIEVQMMNKSAALTSKARTFGGMKRSDAVRRDPRTSLPGR